MSLPQLETPLKILFCDVLPCYLRFSFVFMIVMNLHPFNHVSIFENQNKTWRLGWKSTESTYHHHLFLVRQWKKPWICVAWHVVMMQKPVLCTPLVRHFLPATSMNTLTTPMQNCWFIGWRKKLLKNWLTVQKNGQHALEDWLHLPQLSWMAGWWLFHWDDCCFVPGS